MLHHEPITVLYENMIMPRAHVCVCVCVYVCVRVFACVCVCVKFVILDTNIQYAAPQILISYQIIYGGVRTNN